jgi:hypothetical protein
MLVTQTECMSTQITTSTVLRHVAARTGAGLWRERGRVLLGLAIVAGITGYMALGAIDSTTTLAAGNSPAATGAAGAPSASSDCADTAMAALADKSSTVVQQAYQCMDTTYQQRVPEQTFVDQIQAQKLPEASSVTRVGDYHVESGGSMVYYAVGANDQSVGYIVYVGPDGKILKIE